MGLQNYHALQMRIDSFGLHKVTTASWLSRTYKSEYKGSVCSQHGVLDEHARVTCVHVSHKTLASTSGTPVTLQLYILLHMYISHLEVAQYHDIICIYIMIIKFHNNQYRRQIFGIVISAAQFIINTVNFIALTISYYVILSQ